MPHPPELRDQPTTRLLTGPRLLAGVGLVGLVVAFTARPDAARSAAAQNWSPFVLVTGLLLVGLVADDDGLFAAAGHHLGRVSSNGSPSSPGPP